MSDQRRGAGLSGGDNRLTRRGATNGLVKGLRRVLSTFGVLLLVLGAVGVWPGSPAAADQQDPVKLKAGQSVVVEYDALVGSDSANQGGITRDPANCSTNPYCDTIPIELSVPSDLKSSDTEDYFLRLKVEWDASAGSNMHAYLYDSPFEAGNAPIASSATANNPETINLYRPEKAAYILVVTNVTGVNTGYKLHAAVTIEPFGGAPDFGGVNEQPNRPSSSPPSDDAGSDDDDGFQFDEGSDDSFTPPPTAFDNGLAPPPPLADVDRDESLSALARDRGGFENSLTAPNLSLQEEEPPPPDPVSGATVALLGGLLPAAVVGGGVFWLRRKGGTASAGF